eukprot:TRINITY_DN19956_c0_g1_i1.p1 TRINITY_DN19956_c0_g1~~TRINITY_DN19956_c0_g1_i1.p1  ORF type:complete len:677 (+),score=141.13 TRINITY_DN19956_c0_g1_i1:87-2033(+)
MAKIVEPCLVHIHRTRGLKVEGGRICCLHTPVWTGAQRTALITGAEDGEVREYELRRGDTTDETECVAVYGRHDELVSEIGSLTGPDGGRTFTISHDGTMREWDRGECVHIFDAARGGLIALLVMPDEIYTSTVRGDIIAWHARNRALLRVFSVSSAPVPHLAAFNKPCIVSGSSDGHVCLWQRKEGNPPKRILKGLTDAISSLVVHPDGFAYSSTAVNPAEFPLPETLPTADDIKHNRRPFKPSKPIQGGCISWDLATGWQGQVFPPDVTTLRLYKYEPTVDKSLRERCSTVLVTGHEDGKVRVWLTEGRSTESLEASKDSNSLNAILAQAEAELEELRRIEEHESDIVKAAKEARKPFFGLSLLLTAGLDRGREGLDCLGGSSKGIILRDEITPALNTLFRNSLDARPDLLWSGLSTLHRHVLADESETAVLAKEAVDKKREEIAQIRELAVAADRNISELLTKGQILQTLRALTKPVTAVAASHGVVYGACEGMVTGWDLKTGKHLETLHGLEGTTRQIILNHGWVTALGEQATSWQSMIMPPEARQVPKAAHESYYMPLPTPQPYLAHSIPSPGVNVTEAEINALWEKLNPTKQATIPAKRFLDYWYTLDQYGVEPNRKAFAKSVGETVGYEKFSMLILGYAQK